MSKKDTFSEDKEHIFKFSPSKMDHDLYKEEDNVVNPVIRVKRIAMPNKGEKWRFFENNKNTLTIEGTKLTLKEREFLRSIDGINFMLSSYKSGVVSFNSFKLKLKEKLKSDQGKV